MINRCESKNALTSFEAGNKLSSGVLLRGIACLLMIIACLAPAAAQAAVAAHVDRATVNEGETFTLNLRVSGSDDGQPDVSPLQKDFEVLGTGQRSEIQIINGNVESQRAWTITLSPRKAGKLVIPPITIGKDSSSALEVTVLPAAAASDSGADQGDVFIEVNTRPDSVYVQEQLLYSVRLYYAAPLRQGNLSEPTLDNAIVQKLGDDGKFETQRGGRRYQVIERRYAIFPQRSGTLEIPAVVFDGDVSDQSRRSGDPLFDNFNPSTRHVRLRSRKFDIQVAAQPATYKGATWLPAQDISLEEKWSPEAPQFRVGEPVTRTVIVRAKGLSASQMPDLSQPDPVGLKLYPDQAQTHISTSEDALVSEREQKTAMIPLQAGDLTLPAIHLDWWDTEAKRERRADLPARTIHALPAQASSIGASATTSQAKPSAVPQTITGNTNAAAIPATHRAAASDAQHGTWVLNIWKGLMVFFALSWLITLLLWWRISRSHRATANNSSGADDLTSLAAVKRVRQACRQNDNRALKSALLAWAQIRWPNDPPISLGALANRLDDDQLSAQIARLDQCLYAANATDWQPDQLLKFFTAFLKQTHNRARHDKTAALEPLRLNKSRAADPNG